ncbi:MAG: YbaK/EbsC family protein [Anaerovoracaceae bacterium]
MEDKEIIVYEILDKLEIDYKVSRHQAMFTMADAALEGYYQEGLNMKNLVLKDKKTKTYYMVVIEDGNRLDLKRFKAVTGWSNKVSFVNDEELFELLGIHQGSCSIFNLINDIENKVVLVFEKTIGEASLDEQMSFHPNINTATVSLKKKDVIKFLEWKGCNVIWEK